MKTEGKLSLSHPLAAYYCREYLAAVLQADEVGPIAGHSTNQAHCEADHGKVVGDKAVGYSTDARASEEEKQGPATPQLGDDKGHRPARDLHKGSKEVTLVDISFPQIGSVLHVSVVTHESHHAKRKMSNSKH